MKTLLFALLVTLSAPTWGAAWSPYFKVGHLQLHSNGGFLVLPVDVTILPGDNFKGSEYLKSGILGTEYELVTTRGLSAQKTRWIVKNVGMRFMT